MQYVNRFAYISRTNNSRNISFRRTLRDGADIDALRTQCQGCGHGASIDNGARRQHRDFHRRRNLRDHRHAGDRDQARQLGALQRRRAVGNETDVAGSDAGQREVLYVGREGIAHRALHQVGPLIEVLRDNVVLVINNIDIVANTTH